MYEKCAHTHTPNAEHKKHELQFTAALLEFYLQNQDAEHG